MNEDRRPRAANSPVTFDRRTLNRCLLVGALIFAVRFPYRMFVLPHFPSLDSQPLDLLVVGGVAFAAAWFVFRVWRP